MAPIVNLILSSPQSAKILIGDRQTFAVSPNSSDFGSQSQVGAIGQNSNSSVSGSIVGTCPFATYSVPSGFAGSSAGGFGGISAFPAFGSSTSSTGAASISAFGTPSLLSSSSLQSSNSSKFVFQSQNGGFGQTSNSSSSSFAPGSFGSVNPTATLSQLPAYPGIAAFSSPSSSQPTFGASPAVGSTSSTSAASISAFGSPSLFSSAFGQSSSSSRDSQSQIGAFCQAGNSSSTSFGPGTFGSTNPFATSSVPSVFTSCMQSGCQAPSSVQPIFGASPALGIPATSTSTAPLFTFGTPLFSGGSSVFNHSTGSLFQQTQSSPANQISGPSTLFGPPSQSTFGNNGAQFCSMHNSAIHGRQCDKISSVIPLSGFTGPAFSSSTAPSLTTFKFSKSDDHESLNLKPIFGQPNSAFDTNREMGTISLTSVFGPSATKYKCQGSKVAPYAATPEVFDDVTTPTSGKIVSISAMPTYKHKSHEELKFEDYQLIEGKGCCIAEDQFRAGLSTSNARNLTGPVPGSSGAPSLTTFKFGKSDGRESLNLKPIFGQPNSAFVTNRELGSFTSGPGNMASTVSNKDFGSSSTKCQCQGSRVASYAATPEVLGDVTTPTSGKIVSISAMPSYEHKSHEELKFEDHQLTKGNGCCIAENQFEAGLSASAARNLGSSPIISISILSSGTSSGFSFDMNNNVTISSPKLQFSEPSFGMANALSESTLAQNQSDMLRATSTGLGIQPGIAPLSPETQTTFTCASAPISISNQSSADFSAGIGSQKITIQQSGSQSNLTIGSSPVKNPFGAEPTVQISVDCAVSTTTIQYGISCLRVNDKPSRVIRRSLLTVRHLSLSQNRPTVEKCKPTTDNKKVPFFEEGLPDAYKFKASYIPRGNIRAWLVRPTEEQSTETEISKSSVLEEKSAGIYKEASKEKDGGSSPAKLNLGLDGIFDDNGSQEGKMHVSSQGHQADADVTIYAHDAHVLAILPKLQCHEYYTIPPIDELAAKERADPGFCHHVKDFVVGRHGYGSIKFQGETDVINLDLESIVKFNRREVTVYMDKSKKPAVGQGLNKPAEITLLNVKCINKSTGQLHVGGPVVDKYRQMLIKKGAEQGAEFVSYDPASGELKFKVLHF